MHWVSKVSAFVSLAAIGCGGSGANEAKTPLESAAGAAGAQSSAAGEGNSSAAGGNPSGTGGSSSNASAGSSSAGTSSNNPSGGSAGLGKACKGAAPVCAKNTARSSNAPALSADTWVNISPPQVPFSMPNVFTQALAIDPCDTSTLYLTISAFD